MANLCDQCGESVHRTVFQAEKFLGVDCGCYASVRRKVASVDAPALDLVYSGLVLDHVNDERGNKLKVSSSRELSRAEQAHNFISVVRNQDMQNWNDAPQQRSLRVEDIYKSKFMRR